MKQGSQIYLSYYKLDVLCLLHDVSGREVSSVWEDWVHG